MSCMGHEVIALPWFKVHITVEKKSFVKNHNKPAVAKRDSLLKNPSKKLPITGFSGVND